MPRPPVVDCQPPGPERHPYPTPVRTGCLRRRVPAGGAYGPGARLVGSSVFGGTGDVAGHAAEGRSRGTGATAIQYAWPARPRGTKMARCVVSAATGGAWFDAHSGARRAR